MNLLARARVKFLSSYPIFSSPSLRKPISITLQQSNFYSTKINQKTQQSTQLRTRKPSPSSTFYQTIKNQTAGLTNNVWPKPQQMTYQAEVANVVSLIGFIKMPVLFEADCDGKHFATTVINVGESNYLSIPVVFEGDLAHMVACHVKVNDAVFVSGHLSAKPIRLVLSESVGKFHVVAENVKLVEGLEISQNVVDKKVGIVKDLKKIEEMVESVDNNVYFDQQLKDVHKTSKLGLKKKPKSVERVVDRVDNNIYKHAKTKDESSSFVENYAKPSMIANSEPKPVSKQYQKSEESVSKKKDEDLVLWSDLVKNPDQWWDYRDHKSKGLVKDRFPDFKKKISGESLWISTAPKWILPGIERLEFDVKLTAVTKGDEMRKFGNKNDDLWKNLVENPEKWYDNRAKKLNPKSPDFKHKETGEALWVNVLPNWVLSRLPPCENTV